MNSITSTDISQHADELQDQHLPLHQARADNNNCTAPSTAIAPHDPQVAGERLPERQDSQLPAFSDAFRTKIPRVTARPNAMQTIPTGGRDVSNRAPRLRFPAALHSGVFFWLLKLRRRS
ncbi:MAG: hypothetical protein IPM02_26785 [Betaproteobacteria bacterium]|nr:hypothetical protein [Betaproteobacteria bacterium]